jgi:hypothetical protein
MPQTANYGTTALMQISNTVMERLLTGWSTGGNLNTARGQLAGAGTQTAALAFGGKTPPNFSSNRILQWI